MKFAIIVMGIAFLMMATVNIVALNAEAPVIIRIAQNVAGMELYIFHQTHQHEKPVTIVVAMDISGDLEERELKVGVALVY